MSSQEQLARQWAEKIKSVPPSWHGDTVRAAAEFILANTKPPTMAEVKWSHEEHSLRGATDSYGDEFVMLDMQHPDEESELELFVWDGTDVTRDDPDYYTPNGKRYEIREITEPEHPEFLVTPEDYENAPEGTIIAPQGCNPWVKTVMGGWQFVDVNDVVRGKPIGNNRAKVLRWGWGEDA